MSSECSEGIDIVFPGVGFGVEFFDGAGVHLLDLAALGFERGGELACARGEVARKDGELLHRRGVGGAATVVSVSCRADQTQS